MPELVMDLLSRAWASLQANEFFQGGFLLGLIAAVLAMMRRWPAALWRLLKRQALMQIAMTTEDAALPMMKAWLAQHEYTSRARRWMLIRGKQDHLARAQSVGEDDEGDDEGLSLIPAPGYHWLWWGWVPMLMHFEREPQKVGELVLGWFETITVTLPGRSSERVLRLLREVESAARPVEEGAVKVFWSWYGGWRNAQWVWMRPLETVVLAEGVSEGILEDVRRWEGSEQWYRERGIPWRRGYLLHGPPGNGKTSFACALARTLDWPLYVMALSSVESDNDLRSLLMDVAAPSVVLIEDVSQLYQETPKSVEDKKLTRSGVLNAIDGVAAKEGVVLFMTSNDRGCLDEALCRPGRIDAEWLIGHATRDQAGRLFEQFYGAGNGRAREFGRQVVEGECSMASLQRHFLERPGDPDAAVKDAVLLHSETPDEPQD